MPAACLVPVQLPSRNLEVELTTLSSNYHVEMNPSDVGNNDRHVVQEIIKVTGPPDLAELRHGSQLPEQLSAASSRKELTNTKEPNKRLALPRVIETQFSIFGP